MKVLIAFRCAETGARYEAGDTIQCSKERAKALEKLGIVKAAKKIKDKNAAPAYEAGDNLV